MHMKYDDDKVSSTIPPKDRRGYGAARLPKEMSVSQDMEYPSEPTDENEFKTKWMGSKGSY